MNQTTLHKDAAPLSGPGLHTGHTTIVTLHPAPANTGIVFRRIDLKTVVEIPANVTMVCDTSRNTTLRNGDVSIATIEHLLSALNGLHVDNCYVDINGDEVPILDGSAHYWVQTIQQAGIEQLETPRQYLQVIKTLTMLGDKEGVEYIALPSDEFRVTTIIDFKSRVIGKQVAEFRGSNDDYIPELSSCRTFVFLHEILPLLEAGFIKGGALSNAIVFVDPPLNDEKMTHLADLFGDQVKELKVENGVLNTSPHRYNNEPARHKLLDFIGDISLLGRPVKGHFIIRCPGHKNNAEFCKFLLRQLS